jgi:hypothetical protein
LCSFIYAQGIERRITAHIDEFKLKAWNGKASLETLAVGGSRSESPTHARSPAKGMGCAQKRKAKPMKSKEEIVNNWLPRYTGMRLEDFSPYILLTNFQQYVDLFAEWHGVPVIGEKRPMKCATAEGITIINFGMGSPVAATMMDLLSAICPKAVLFLGKCGGLKAKK